MDEEEQPGATTAATAVRAQLIATGAADRFVEVTDCVNCNNLITIGQTSDQHLLNIWPKSDQKAAKHMIKIRP